jgi:hypothetical protein
MITRSQNEDHQILDNYQVVSPLAGRDYRSKKECEAAFLGGWDFTIQPDGVPCSIRDFAPGVKVNIRYKAMTMVHTVIVPDGSKQIRPPQMRHEKFMELKGFKPAKR